MLKFDLNWIHVATATLANFMLGWAWFSHALFAKPWLRGMGKDPKHKPTKKEMAEMPRMMVWAFVSALLMAFGMAVLVASLGAADAMAGLELGLLAGITLIAAHALGRVFEGRKMVVIAVSAGYGVACLAVDGLILAAWH